MQDLRSTNLLEVCTALAAASSLVSAEMMPAVIPVIEDKLTHSRYYQEIDTNKHDFWPWVGITIARSKHTILTYILDGLYF